MSIAPFSIEGVIYIFVNDTADALGNSETIRAMFKEGMRMRHINCIGAPVDHIIHYESIQKKIVISNITALFDTNVFDYEGELL